MQPVIPAETTLGAGIRRRTPAIFGDALDAKAAPGAQPDAGLHRHGRSVLVREGGFALKTVKDIPHSNTIAYPPAGSSSNNLGASPCR